MRTVLILALLLILSSCAPRYLMPTPNMHTSKDATDYTIVPAELRSSAVEIMYVTDRMPKTLEDGSFGYGHKRSSSLAFGHTTIEIGDDLSWPDLLAASVTQDRKQELPVDQQNITEIARFADTPLRVVLKEGVYQFAVEDIERQVQTTNKMNSYISDKLKILPQKDVILFVHGYNNSFEDASLTLAELWHFSGRQSLPILYSWPAEPAHPLFLAGGAGRPDRLCLRPGKWRNNDLSPERIAPPIGAQRRHSRRQDIGP